MRVNIVYSAQFRPNDITPINKLKDLAPTWGSWKSWQVCDTDNVVCHELSHARELCKRELQTQCNLYLPQKFHHQLARPMGVNFYQGDFQEETIDIEDTVCMHLVAPHSDLVLMFGFDFSNPGVIEDRFENHRMKNRFGLARGCMASYPDVQWVAIDHGKPPDLAFDSVPNFTRDVLKNVLQLLS